MKKIIIGIAVLAMAATLLDSCSSCSSRRQTAETELNDSTKNANEMKKMEEPEFEMVTSHGTMKLKLYAKTPKHRENFSKLVAEKYYDGIRFHRVIEGFMIQAGDPFSRDTSMIGMWGQGGPDYTVPAEFVNEYWHKKGALAAARKGDMANPTKASSGSQFYIVHDENACLHLDGQYSIFGEVVEGLDVIDKIASVDVDRMDRPYEDVIIVTVKPVVEQPEVPAQTDSTAADAGKEE
jgi:cyclophilin family peptidyl-prolyl cis-trans isomerase